MLAACGLQHDETVTNDHTSKEYIIKPVLLKPQVYLYCDTKFQNKLS